MATGISALVEMPRGPVVMNYKSGTEDYPDNWKRDLLRWRDYTREDAIRTLRLNPEFELLADYIRLLSGQFWPAEWPRYRSKYFDNRMADARIERLSLLTDIRPTIDVKSRNVIYRHQAPIVQAWIHHEWQRLNADLKLVAVVDHAQFGAGYWKVGCWMPGTMTLTPCGMDCVLEIQPAYDLQESAGVLYRTYKNLSYFRAAFGSKADGVEKEASKSHWTSSTNQYQRPGFLTEYTWNSLSPQMRYALGSRAVQKAPIQYSPFPVIELEEYWIDDPEVNDSHVPVLVKDPNMSTEEHNYWYEVKPGERLWPRKRLIVFGGDKPISDGPNVYWHGFYPFAKLCLDPIVWGPGGLSVFRNLAPLNKAINEIGAGIIDMVRKAVNPQLVVKENIINKTTWNQFYPDMPGGKLRISPAAAGPNEVRYIEPPSLPGFVQQFLQYLIGTFDRRAGRLDTGRLIGKKQLPGSDAIENLREAMTAPFRLESRYIEEFLEKVGEQAISHCFQFSTRDYRVAIMGPEGQTPEDFDKRPEIGMIPWSVKPEVHWKTFAFTVARGSLHGAHKDRDMLKLMALRRQRDISRRRLLKELDIGDIDQIEAELEKEAKSGAGAPAGRVPRMSRGQRTGRPF